jgi:hypothetical protein
MCDPPVVAQSASACVAMAAKRFLPRLVQRGEMIRLTINALWLALSLLPRQPAIAGMIDSPECRRDLMMADQLIHAVRLRENSVQPGDFVGLCRLLRQNLQDMTRAREPMARCMTGHERGENVGQMDASLDDIRFVLSQHCAGR